LVWGFAEGSTCSTFRVSNIWRMRCKYNRRGPGSSGGDGIASPGLNRTPLKTGKRAVARNEAEGSNLGSER
jgi:hypothetical protein